MNCVSSRRMNSPGIASLDKLVFLFCGLLFLLPAVQPLRAQTLLDPAFNGDGKVIMQIAALNSKAYDSIIQPDGKIVTVGSVNTSSNLPQSYQIALVRYNQDGSLDTSFDGDGKVLTTPDQSRVSEARSAVLQPDGKIVVVGVVGINDGFTSSDAVVLRYHPNGSLDTSFDGDGFKFYNFDAQTAQDIASDAAVQTDGKILLAAGTIAAGFQGFVVARLNADGSFDNSFGTTGGYTRTHFGNQIVIGPKMALTADGKILLTGDAIGIKLLRFTVNGLPDNAFGTNGVINNAGGDSLRLQPDGKIVTVNTSSQVNNIVRRYHANGALDTSFGVGGARIITFTNDDGNLKPPSDLAIQADGKIVIGGSVRVMTQPNRDFALTRLTANGAIDTLFGFNGQLLTEMQGFDTAHSILVQPDGKIVLTGESAGGFSIARYVAATLANTCRPVSDFDGDAKSDLAVFTNSGEWIYRLAAGGMGTIRWGLSTDRIVPADYDGDCRTDFAVYRDGIWYIKTSGVAGTQIYYQFGLPTDLPVPGDYDGDDLADAAVYRDGVWYVRGTRNGFFAVQFGLAGDKPVAGDYDGDGKEDFAVYRDGVWYLLQSNLGFGAVQFGLPTDQPAVGDYDGDGKTDIAVYRPSDGTWYLLRSNLGFAAVRWGISTDVPVAADYDGDGKTDIAVYRSGDWYLLQSVSGYELKQFGGAADKPIQNAFVP